MISSLQGVNLFLISLFSVYISGIPILTIVGTAAFLLLGFLENRKFKIQAIVLSYLFLLFLLSTIAVCFGQGFDASRFSVFISFLFICIMLPGLISAHAIPKMLSVFLLMHLFFFYLQFFAYYVTGVHLNLLSSFGLESRNLGGSLTLPWGPALMRSSGVFSEPGTYACFVAPMIALFSGHLKTKFYKIIYYAALLSLALSLSTFGLVFFLLIAFFSLKSFVLKTILLIVGIGFAAPYFYWRFVERLKDGLDTGLGFRYEYVVHSLEGLIELDRFLIGYGGFGVNKFPFSTHGADNDSGLITYVLYNFGGIAFFLSIALILYSFYKKPIWSFIGVFIIFISKMSFYAYAFPVYMVLLMHEVNNKEKS